MAIIKTLTIDGFYQPYEATRIYNVVSNLTNYEEREFGTELRNFNMIPEGANELFSKVLGRKVEVTEEQSGVFRYPKLFVHFEGFDQVEEWIFVVALELTTFNVFRHLSGAKTALDGYNFDYRNLLEWDIGVNYQLEPGQGVFFRPWLFHGFDGGLVQIFRLRETP